MYGEVCNNGTSYSNRICSRNFTENIHNTENLANFAFNEYNTAFDELLNK